MPLLTAALVTVTTQGAAAQSCPANARFVGVEQHGDVKKYICTCNVGYEKRGGACVRQAVIRPPNERELRGLRAQCVRDEGRKLARALKVCEKSLFSCLVNKGNAKGVAICATTVLIAAIDPTKAAALAALAVCGLETPEAAEAVQACRREAECKVEKTKLHDERVVACKR